MPIQMNGECLSDAEIKAAAKNLCWKARGGSIPQTLLTAIPLHARADFQQAWNEKAEKMATEGRR